MHISLISLRVPHPEEVSAWYRTHLGLTVTATHPQTGRVVLATDEPGTSLIFLPGDPPDHPERIQLHFRVADLDATYAQLQHVGARSLRLVAPWRDHHHGSIIECLYIWQLLALSHCGRRERGQSS